MVIVDSEQELNIVCDKLRTADVVIIPVFSNNYTHARLQTVCLFWIHVLQDTSDYILLTNHSEALYKVAPNILNSNLLEGNIKFILNLKDFLNSKDINFKDNLNFKSPGRNVYDIEMLQYLDSGTKLTFPYFNTAQQYNTIYPRYPKINELIPVSKWIEYFESIKPTILNLVSSYNPLDRAYKYYNEIIIPALSSIESNGLKVSVDKINKNIMKSANVDVDTELMYSQYNICTTTGRPSNRFNTINFAALNKENGDRDKFISRHETGALVEFDYDAYHLRIIGNLIGYDLPTTSMHEYLGKQYFNTDSLTLDQYEESKQISFRQLYGGILPEYKHIDFFNKADVLIAKLWKQWNTNGYIESPVSYRRLYKKNFPSLSAQKLFNYLIQLLETEINMKKIMDIHQYLEKYNTRLILYTYDSITLDFDFKDGKRCLTGIQKILQRDNYVIRKYAGYNYGMMQEIHK